MLRRCSAILPGRILHPPASEIIQTVCAPVSLISCTDGHPLRLDGCPFKWNRSCFGKFAKSLSSTGSGALVVAVAVAAACVWSAARDPRLHSVQFDPAHHPAFL